MNRLLGAPRRPFRLAPTFAVAAITALLVGGVALPARAVDVTVGDEAELALALTTASTTRVILGADVTVASSKLTVSSPSLVLDLNGHTLTTNTVDLQPGVSLTITGDAAGAGTLNAFGRGAYNAGLPAIATADATLVIDSGTVTALGDVNASNYSAAIGGYGDRSSRGDGGTVIVNGGTVTARANYSSAIGSGIYSRDVGSIVINGGVVDAQGQAYGSALGGSHQGSGGSVLITGGQVTAVGYGDGVGIGGGSENPSAAPHTVDITGGTVDVTIGHNGVGIGGGANHPGSYVTIGEGAEVSMSSFFDYSPAFGSDTSTMPFGSLTVAGALTFTRSFPFSTSLASSTIAPTGVLTGAFPLRGNGSIENYGTIATPSVSGLTVTGHNYPVTFAPGASTAYPANPADAQTVTVYAPTFVAGNRTAPAVSRGGYTFTGWNSAADGSGSEFTESTVLTGPTTLYAIWGPASLTVTPERTSAVAGDSIAFSAATIAGDTASDATAATTFRSDTPSDTVTGASIRFTAAGTRTITATSVSFSATTTVSVVAGPLDSLTVVPSAPTVAAGDTGSFTVAGFDEFRNAVDASAATLASSDDSDLVLNDGRSIRFSKAGDRTVTATLGGVTGSATVSTEAGELASITLDPVNSEYSAGGSTRVVALGFDGEGNALGDVSASTVFTTDTDADSSVAPDGIDGADITFYRAGARTITATNGAVTASVGVSVYAVLLDRIEIDPAAATVGAGESLDFTVREYDAFGNPLDFASDIELGTGRDGDTVDGLAVRFSAAGTATVTATATSSVSPETTASAAATVEVVAGELASVVIGTGDRTAIAGQPVTIAVEGFDAEGNSTGDVGSDAVITSDVASDVVDGTEITATAAGTRTLTVVIERTPVPLLRAFAFAAAAVGDVSGSVDLVVVADAANPASLVIELDGTPAAGATVVARVIAFDRFGNRIGDVTDTAVLTTNNPADIVRGASITFASGGVHVVSASLGAVTASQSVAVSALPQPVAAVVAAAAAAGATVLAYTGADIAPVVWTASGLLVLGLAILLLRRRRAQG